MAYVALLIVVGGTVAVVAVSSNDGKKRHLEGELRSAKARLADKEAQVGRGRRQLKAARLDLRKSRTSLAKTKRRLATLRANPGAPIASAAPAAAQIHSPAPKPSTGATPSVDSPEGRRVLQTSPECLSHPPPPGYHGPVQC